MRTLAYSCVLFCDIMYSSDLRNKGTNKRSGTSQGAFLLGR
nr:MAG TPA: hypothetical protein [Caudoviricetes sp.]